MQLAYLGLADLGKTVTAEPGQMYQQVDICEDNDRYPTPIIKTFWEH